MTHAFNLGNNKPLIDGRNITLGKVQPASAVIPDVYMNKKAWELTPAQIDLWYQRNTPSCGAHATSLYKYLLDSNDKTSSGKEYSARFSWNRIRVRDGLPPSEGSSFKTIMETLRKDGACDIDLLANDSTLSDLEYAYPAITPEMLQNATPKQIGGYTIDTAPSWNAMRQAIWQNGYVILLTDVSERWWTDTNGNLTWEESKILPLTANAKTVSRHYFVAHSYDQNYIYGLNSFSSQWGKGGHLYFGKDYVPHVLQMATAQDIPDAVVKNLIAQKTVLERLVALYKQLVELKVKKYV